MGSSKDFRRLGDKPNNYFKGKPTVIKKSSSPVKEDNSSKEFKPRVSNGEGNSNTKSSFTRVPKPNFGGNKKPFNKSGFKPGNGKSFNKGKGFDKNKGKFDRNDPKFKKKKPYIQKKAGNKGVGFRSSNYNDLNKGKKGKTKALAKGLNIHRWLNAHDGIQSPRNILKVTIAQALGMITNIDSRIEVLLKYLNETTPKKETMKEYESKLHTLVDLQNRRKGITGVLHKQNALITINFEFSGVQYTQTIDMLLLSIREMKKMLGILAKDPKSKTNNKTNPFNATKKQMVALLETLTEKLTEYNRVTLIEIPR